MNAQISEIRIYKKHEEVMDSMREEEQFCYWTTAAGEKGDCSVENKDYGLRITKASGGFFDITKLIELAHGTVQKSEHSL